MKAPLAATLLGAVALIYWGLGIDDTRPLAQFPLFAGLQFASVLGAALGAWTFRRLRPEVHPLALALAAIVAWRLAYFPIMVFSGHVASIGEWLLILVGAPVAVYPTFLLSVAGIHFVAANAAGLLLSPPVPLLRWVIAPAFLVAVAVSFNQVSDITLLPDTVSQIEDPIPLMRAEEANPYLPAFSGPGYWPNQRVVLLAAGLTYETIPPSPWATTVKAVLEDLFHAKPFGSSRDRVLEHYLAYHSAHSQIGCRDLADCPPDAP